MMEIRKSKKLEWTKYFSISDYYKNWSKKRKVIILVLLLLSICYAEYLLVAVLMDEEEKLTQCYYLGHFLNVWDAITVNVPVVEMPVRNQ